MATLKVWLHEARDLPVMDRSTGLADTYAVLRLDDLEFTSQTCTATRFPVWNSEYRFDTPDLLVLQEDPLEVRVYDHDILSRDPLVGFVNIDCNSFMYRYNPTISGWFPIFDTSTGLRGDIRLTLRIKFHAAENPLAPRIPDRVVPRLALCHSAELIQQLRTFLEYHHNRNISGDNYASITSAEAQPGNKHNDAVHPDASPFPPELYHYFSQHSEEPEPIVVQRSQQPTLASEEEGVYIFSVSRLDPSVYRVEAVYSMVEELIVKADPEHYRLTNLRSTRNVNRARLVQLFKLSGKVRRQLAHKVIGLHCNAVLGYAEEFDMEPHGIIVRAYGTPCLISRVKFCDVLSPKQAERNTTLRSKSVVKPKGGTTPESGSSVPGKTREYDRSMDAGKLNSADSSPKIESLSPEDEKLPRRDAVNRPLPAASPPISPPLLPISPGNATERSKNQLVPADAVVSGSRANIIVLSVKELPFGCIQHIGGYICARSVKIISKNKSKPIISQERDVWWMELREELRANARAFHCNAILGYEEVSQYQDDVALLSLSGTAVMIQPSMASLRGGADLLFRMTCSRYDTKKQCSILHLYNTSHRHTTENSRWSPHSVCNICQEKIVPNFILSSCAVPVELQLSSPPRLIEVHVAQSKKDVKNIDLAKVASQALPFIEFALHKQLLFHLRLRQLNSCFGMKVSIVLGPDVIVGTLTGTGCRVVGLPIPLLPRLEVVDPLIAKLEPVKQLEELVKRGRRRRGRSLSSSRSSSESSDAASSSESRRRSHSTHSSSSWVRSDDSSSEIYHPPEQISSGSARFADVIVKIDDEEEADVMLGMQSMTKPFQDSILITIPYIPDCPNSYSFKNEIVLVRRYSIGKALTSSGGDTSINHWFNSCCANAQQAFSQRVSRIAMRLPDVERVQVLNFRITTQFEQNSHDMCMRLEGAIVGQNTKKYEQIMRLEKRAFKHCLQLISLSPSTPHSVSRALQQAEAYERILTPNSFKRGSNISKEEDEKNGQLKSTLTNPNPLNLFMQSTAPFSLPYVFRRDVPALKQWFPQMAPDSREQEPSEIPERLATYDAFRVRQITGAKSIRRQMQSLISNIKTSFNRIAGKTRGSGTGKGAADGEPTFVDAGNSHCPILRLPDDINTLHHRITLVQMTSADYIPGHSIVRYLGRLSQHYIREDNLIFTTEDRGCFYQGVEREVDAMTQSMVITQGGNALLQHSVVFHEIEDSDGSGNASGLITVTGDVVQVTNKLVADVATVFETNPS